MAHRAPEQRSRVTNGKALHAVTAKGNSAWGRRFRDVIAEMTNDLGGPSVLSEAQRQLIRRAATLSIACEQMEVLAAQGKQFDLDAYGTFTDRLGRAVARLGLKRVPRDVTPTLEQHLSRKASAAEVPA